MNNIEAAPKEVAEFVFQHSSYGCHACNGIIGFGKQLLQLADYPLVTPFLFLLFHAQFIYCKGTNKLPFFSFAQQNSN
jgi:hypothetical protein